MDHTPFPALPAPLEKALEEGDARWAILPASEISFDPIFRKYCKDNVCGKYGACWSCPPDIGTYEELKARVQAYDTVLLFSRTYPIEGADDLAGMLEAGKQHNRFTAKIQRLVRPLFPHCFVTGTGDCRLCDTCTRPENLPCRLPDEMLTSLEACGANVIDLAEKARLPWKMESRTIIYFSAILLYRSQLFTENDFETPESF